MPADITLTQPSSVAEYWERCDTLSLFIWCSLTGVYALALLAWTVRLTLAPRLPLLLYQHSCEVGPRTKPAEK